MHIKTLWQLNGGEEADVPGVAVGRASGHEWSPQRSCANAGGHRWDWQSEHYPSTRPNPQHVSTGQESCDPQTCSLVLADNGIRA